MGKYYNRNVLCEHYRCFTITNLQPLGDTEWYYCHSEAKAMFSAVLGNGRKIKGRVWIDGTDDEKSPECVFYIGDDQIHYDDTDEAYTDEAYEQIAGLARRVRATESCIEEMMWYIRDRIVKKVPKRDYNSEILPRVPHITWLSMEAKRVGDYEAYDQFIGTADISLRLPDCKKEVSVTVRDYSCGPEYGSRVITTTNLDGHSYNIAYGSMDDASLLYGTELYMALHTAEKEIGIPWGTLMPIIKRVQQRLMYRLDSV